MLTPIQKVGHRCTIPLVPGDAMRAEDCQLSGARIWQRLQHDGVENAEHCHAGADSEAENNNHRDGEDPVAAE